MDDGFDFGALDLRDVDKDKDMNTFLQTAAAAAEEYEGVRRDIKLVDTSGNVPKVASNDKKIPSDCRSNAGEPKSDVPKVTSDFKVTSDLKITSDSRITEIDTKSPANRFEDKLNAEFFTPAQSSLHKVATDLPSTLPPKGWKKAARSNKHVKTKRLYPRE